MEIKPFCKTCDYFQQHYIYANGAYIPVDKSYCIRPPGMRQRKAENQGCLRWKHTETQEETRKES